MSVAALGRLSRELEDSYAVSLLGSPSAMPNVMPKETPLQRLKNAYHGNVARYRSYIKDLGRKYGVIPNEVAHGVISQHDLPEPMYLGRAGKIVGKYADYAIKSLTEQFSRTQEVIPYYWNKIKVGVADLPGLYVMLKNGAKKKILGVLGMYIPSLKAVIMDKSLMTGDYLGGNDDVRKNATRHEFFHAAQDEAGTIDWAMKNKADPVATIEGEATVFGGGEKLGVYKDPVRRYHREYGNSPLTNFRHRAGRYLRELGGYASSLFGPQPQPALAPA